jgi:hypothetical protein
MFVGKTPERVRVIFNYEVEVVAIDEFDAEQQARLILAATFGEEVARHLEYGYVAYTEPEGEEETE